VHHKIHLVELSRRSPMHRALLLALCLVVPVFGTGCQQLIQLIGAVAGGGLGGGGFNPGSLGGGGLGGSLPPGLLNGNSGPLSPNSTLPPPPGGQRAAQEILREYGVPVTGSGATAENLANVALAMSRYKREHLQGLRQIDIPAVQSHNLNGLWQSRGGGAKITLWAHQRRRTQVLKHTAAHEIGHHVTLLSRRNVLGQNFSYALGSGPNAIPRSYAATNWREKVADNLAFILLGNDNERRPAPQWRPTVRAMQIVEQEFGRSASNPGTSPGTQIAGTNTPTSQSTPRPGTGASGTS